MDQDHSVKSSKPSQNADVLDYAVVVENLARQQKLTEAKVRSMVRALCSVAGEALKAGKIVNIPGLGRLQVRHVTNEKPLKEGEKPRPEKRIVFAPAKALKDSASV